MTGRVVAAVNRKGGVGKTTLVVALADTIVSEFKASVVVVDADPQASASIALVGAEQTLQLSENGRCLAAAIKARRKRRNTALDQFMVGHVGRIKGRADVPLALLSNGEELWDLELDLASPSQVSDTKAATSSIVGDLKKKYDYVLIDCPPGQTHTSSTFLSEADLILSPTVPDRLSNWGLDGLQRYISTHMRDDAAKAFFVATRYRSNLNEHKEYFGKLASRPPGTVNLLRREAELLALEGVDTPIGTFIDEDVRFVQRMGENSPRTFAQIYGQKAAIQLIELAKAMRRELAQ